MAFGQSLLAQGFRYVIIGCVIFAIDVGLFAIFVSVESDLYVVANIVSKFVSAAVGFVLHKCFTFSWDQEKRGLRQFTYYCILLSLNTLLSTGLLYLAVDLWHSPTVASKIGADIVVISLSFLASRWIIFRAAS